MNSDRLLNLLTGILVLIAILCTVQCCHIAHEMRAPKIHFEAPADVVFTWGD